MNVHKGRKSITQRPFRILADCERIYLFLIEIYERDWSIPNSLYFCIFMFPSSSICTDMFHFAFLGYHGLHSPDALFRPACFQATLALFPIFL